MTEHSTEVAVRRAAAPILSDDEYRRVYRLAESLYLSGMFKDVAKAETAFAKIMLGRDLGLSPTEALSGLYLVEGNIQVSYPMLARFIKERAEDGYAYRSGWLRQNPVEDGGVPEKARDAVWIDQDDPTDTRETVGAFVEFRIHDESVGVSTYTVEDARTAGLIKENAKAAWNTARRNMLLARAMSNGVKWIVPEVMGGLSVYVEGEIVVDKSLTAPTGDGDDSGTGVDLGPGIEKTIARAEALGHRGLSNRAALELQLGGRAPSVVKQFVADAKVKLDEFEERKKAEAEEGEPPDAEVVEEVEETAAESEPEESDPNQLQIDVLQNRIAKLGEVRGEEQDPEQRALIDEEVDHLQDQLRELGVEPAEIATDTEE